MFVFLHIAKTAGGTFSSIVQRYFEPGQVLDNGIIYPYCRAHQMPYSAPIPFETALQWLSPDQKKPIKCICAHMKYGMHKYFANQAYYVTFLREPTARAISAYYHIKRDKEHRFHNATSKLTLEEYFESEAASRLANLHTRLISGTSEPNNPEILNIAKHRLENDFSYFGISEYFDESLVGFSESRLGRDLGWPLLYYTRRNVATNYKANEHPSKRVIELIKEKNQLDFELYDFALTLFRKNISNINKFQNKLDKFRFMNEQYNRINRFTSRMPINGKNLAQTLERLLLSYLRGISTRKRKLLYRNNSICN